jgi:hypothetical protein
MQSMRLEAGGSLINQSTLLLNLMSMLDLAVGTEQVSVSLSFLSVYKNYIRQCRGLDHISRTQLSALRCMLRTSASIVTTKHWHKHTLVQPTLSKHRYGVKHIIWTNFLVFSDLNGIGVNSILKSTTADVPSLQAFQSYLISEIVTDEPDTLRNKAKTIEWLVTTGCAETALKNVLNFTSPAGPNGFSIIASQRLVKEKCDFWDEVCTEAWTETARSITSPQ